MLGRGGVWLHTGALSRLDNLVIVVMRKKLKKVTAHVESVLQDWMSVPIYLVDLELEDPTPSGRGDDA